MTPAYPLPIHIGSVGGAHVLDEVGITLADDPAVHAGHALAGEAEVVLGGST